MSEDKYAHGSYVGTKLSSVRVIVRIGTDQKPLLAKMLLSRTNINIVDNDEYSLDDIDSLSMYQEPLKRGFRVCFCLMFVCFFHSFVGFFLGGWLCHLAIYLQCKPVYMICMQILLEL